MIVASPEIVTSINASVPSNDWSSGVSLTVQIRSKLVNINHLEIVLLRHTEERIELHNSPLVAGFRSVLSASTTLFPTHMSASSG